MTISERLKLIRGKESRESFSQKIGIHPQTLYRYERGGRELDSGVIIAICKEFCVSPAWLLLGDGPMRLEEKQSVNTSQHGQSQPSEITAPIPCVRCEKLEAKLEKVEKQRDDLVEANRKLLKENGTLREENATLRERQRKEQASLFDESPSITSVAQYGTPPRLAKP